MSASEPTAEAPSLSRPRGGIKPIWGVVLGLVIVVAILETALHIHNPFGFRMRGDEIVLPRNQVYHFRDVDPATGELMDLHGKLDVDMVHTKNSLGFRGPEPPANFAQSLTIIAIGGSTTECMFLGDGFDWPAQLAQDLRPAFQSLWMNNAGLDGQSSWGHLHLLRQYISGLRPRVVLMMAGMNEPYTDAPNTYDSEQVLTTLGWLGRYSELVALGLNLYHQSEVVHVKDLNTMPRPINFWDPGKRTPNPSYEQLVLDDEKGRLVGYHDRLEQFIGMAREHGIQPVFITQPAAFGPGKDAETGRDLSTMAVDLFGPLTGEGAWKLLDTYNGVMRDVAAKDNVPLIDLAHEMPKNSRYYYDFIHFSKAGAKLAGQIVSADLCPDLRAAYPGLATGACPVRR